MEKIDRLGWAAGISLTSYGLKIGIRVTDPSVLPAVEEILPPGWRRSRSPIVDRLYSLVVGGTSLGSNLRRFHIAYVGSRRIARARELPAALEAIENNLQLHVAERAPDRVFVHAGVVAWRGKAIVLPGRSFAGKTTLVATLLRSGATYYSDEYAVLDSGGLVHPYPKPLSMRDGGNGDTQEHPAEMYGADCGTEPIPVGLVLVSRYKPDSRWRPRRLSPGRALLELLANTVPARREPERILPTLREVVLSAACFKGFRGDAQEASQPILNRMATW